MMADPDRLRQVVWNLLSNAVKFTPDGGVITVSLRRIEGQAEIVVADTGVGIAPDFMPFIFDRFRQFDSSRTRKLGGLGLGLAISKQLVELHGGTIGVHSEGTGKGSTFVVRLPVARRASPAPGKQADASMQRPARSQGNKPGSPSLEGCNILLVEDDPQTRNAIILILEEAGAKVAFAARASDALKAYRDSRPDLIVSDIGLPDMDGHELLRRMRALDAQRNVPPVPAIALTAYAREADRQQAQEAGYAIHMAKPIDREKLVAALASLAAQH